MEENLRLDVLLHRLCLTRSRSEAKNACEAGAIHVAGRPAKASQGIEPGERITLRFPRRLVEVTVLELPGKSVSKKTARELYEIVREEAIEDSGAGQPASP